MKNILGLEQKEIIDVSISVLAIAISLAVAGGGLPIFLGYADFFILIFFLLLTIGAGFILHELAHKFVAMSYGAHAHFRMWKEGIVVMLFLSVLGFVFAAPGAVYISFSPNAKAVIAKRENGFISLAGPLTNLILLLLFLVLGVYYPITFTPVNFDFEPFQLVGNNVWFFGAWINFVLAMFNLLPIVPLDGSKIFYWNKPVWFVMLVLLVGLGLSILPLEYFILILVWMLALAALSKIFFFRS